MRFVSDLPARRTFRQTLPQSDTAALETTGATLDKCIESLVNLPESHEEQMGNLYCGIGHCGMNVRRSLSDMKLMREVNFSAHRLVYYVVKEPSMRTVTSFYEDLERNWIQGVMKGYSPIIANDHSLPICAAERTINDNDRHQIKEQCVSSHLKLIREWEQVANAYRAFLDELNLLVLVNPPKTDREVRERSDLSGVSGLTNEQLSKRMVDLTGELSILARELSKRSGPPDTPASEAQTANTTSGSVVSASDLYTSLCYTTISMGRASS
jgi:hypothetical protein